MILAILFTGFSGLLAQVLLLRELMVNFYGNELVLGVILSNWIISEAAGVFIVGRFIDRAGNKEGVFSLFAALFALALPVTLYLSRAFKGILGIPPAEGMGLCAVLAVSLLAVLPAGFSHGALFNSLCKIYSLRCRDSLNSAGRVYAWEIVGTIIGGIAATYFFIPRFDSFQTSFLVSAAALIICLIFFKRSAKIFRYSILCLAAAMLCFYLSGGVKKIQGYSIRQQWKGERVLDYRNSLYGNVLVTQRDEQLTFFYNGIPVIITPYPDIAFIEEFGQLPLLFHPQPREILIIGAGSGGLINEALKYPVEKIDYLELDASLLDMLRKYPSGLTLRELNDRKVKVVNLDGRAFIRGAPQAYDVLFIGLSKPLDLTINRLFTREFFSLAKEKLNPGGIVAFCLPGSLTYLSREMKDLNACVLNALKDAFCCVRVIPGDYNLFLASDAQEIKAVNPALIRQRIAQRNIKTNLLVPDYLSYRLDPEKEGWLKSALSGATKKINRDFMPVAVFEMSLLWNKEFSPYFTNILRAAKNLRFWHLAVLILMLTLACSGRQGRGRSAYIYAIAATGFFGMLMSLILLLAFQVVYGYLYHLIGILLSIFMAGMALGSLYMVSSARRGREAMKILIWFEVAIGVFSYLAGQAITGLSAAGYSAWWAFCALFFITGLLVGGEFPLINSLFPDKAGRPGEAVGILYSADLLGGWLAGLLGGVIFLPILGLFNTCMVMVLLKLSSLALLLLFLRSKNRLTGALN